MDKIKVALTSGATLEKPLVSAFKGNAGSYVVLDNEVNGTMGLPIILVAKYADNRLIKIADQNEWNGVKEVLRNIISGNQVDYITVPAELMADDGFFSQLTLPIASFESLKANYKPGDASASAATPNVTLESAPATPAAPVAPEQPAPAVTPAMPEMPTPQEVPAPPVAPAIETPVAPGNMQTAAPVEPQPIPTPEPTPAPVPEPISPEPVVAPPVAPAVEPPVPPVAPVMPSAPEVAVSPAPVVEPIPAATPVENTPIDFSVEKEAFMKACENMFDALVAKFNK